MLDADASMGYPISRIEHSCEPVVTDLSHPAKQLLRAYVHAMAVGYSVEDNEGVYPDVMRVMSGQNEEKAHPAFVELEAAHLIGGYTEPSDLKAVWITPDGIRRAVSEGWVEKELAWTLWPHDDLAYEAVLAEMGDHDFDSKAAAAWGEIAATRAGGFSVERGEWAHIRSGFAVYHAPRVLRTIVDAVVLGIADGPSVYAPVISCLMGLTPNEARALRAFVKDLRHDGYVTARDIDRDPYPIRLTEHGIETVVRHGMIPEHLQYLLASDADLEADHKREFHGLRAKVAPRYPAIEKAGEIHDRMIVESENIF